MLGATLPSSISSNNLKELIENNNDDSVSYFENNSDIEKEESFFRGTSSEIHETILEKSKDERFAKVWKIQLIYNLNFQ